MADKLPLDGIACRCLPLAGNRLIERGRAEPNRGERTMPSLLRFFAVVAILAGLVYAGMWSLANLVQPQPRDMSVTIPQDRIGK
jgi:hypothetical protein